MNYFIGDKSYPAPTRDELIDQVPSFKKRFKNYSSYATATIENILGFEEIETSGVHRAHCLATAYLQNDGHGFTFEILPPSVQFSPTFFLLATDINDDGKLDIVGGGNLSKMGAGFGRASSSFGYILIGDGKGGFDFIPTRESGLCIRGDVRKILKGSDNSLIFALSNDAPAAFDRTGK